MCVDVELQTAVEPVLIEELVQREWPPAAGKQEVMQYTYRTTSGGWVITLVQT